MWLVCKTCAKILLSDPKTSLTTLRLLPLRRSRWSYGNYQSPQSSGSSRNILKRLGQSGRSGRSYGNQALTEEGSTILRGHLSHANFVWSRESNLRPPALQSSTLLTEQIFKNVHVFLSNSGKLFGLQTLWVCADSPEASAWCSIQLPWWWLTADSWNGQDCQSHKYAEQRCCTDVS